MRRELFCEILVIDMVIVIVIIVMGYCINIIVFIIILLLFQLKQASPQDLLIK